MITLFAAAVIAGPNAKAATDDFAHMKKEHSEVLKKWLIGRKGLRPAVAADADQESLKAWRETTPSFFPYYIAGDFNRDGKGDFAVVLKAEGSRDTGVLAVFNGPFTDSNPAYLNRMHPVRRFYFEFHDDEKLLYFTEYETHGFYLRPKGSGYEEWDPHDDF